MEKNLSVQLFFAQVFNDLLDGRDCHWITGVGSAVRKEIDFLWIRRNGELVINIDAAYRA